MDHDLSRAPAGWEGFVDGYWEWKHRSAFLRALDAAAAASLERQSPQDAEALQTCTGLGGESVVEDFQPHLSCC